jgi:hypothetical protein
MVSKFPSKAARLLNFRFVARDDMDRLHDTPRYLGMAQRGDICLVLIVRRISEADLSRTRR